MNSDPALRHIDVELLPPDNGRLQNLCGPVDENLRQIETAFDIVIARRGGRCRISGETSKIRLGEQALLHFYRLANKALPLEVVQLDLIELARRKPSPERCMALGTDVLDTNETPRLKTRKHGLHGRTPNQLKYLAQIHAHDITFGVGPAGTGKTFLAVAAAVDAFERDMVSRIMLVRPAVEAGERLGFLPGDLAQKVDPYLRPLYDALYELMGYEKVSKLFEKQVIEIAPLAYMRGRTLSHAFVILDEAQNTTPEQMKMFLTRIGVGSKAVITGDITQIDLPRGHRSGLIEARQILHAVRGLGFVDFDSSDVVRHPLVARIVEAYEHHGATRP